jgi:hypothetical protein
MMANLTVEIDTSGVRRFFEELSQRGIDAAWTRTLRKTGAWIKSQTAKEVSTETKIPQKELRRRLRYYLKGYGEKVWLGLRPLAAHRLGKTKRTRTGVTAGKFRFPGAFTFGNKSGKPAFYRRNGQVELARLEWDEAGKKAFENVAGRIEARLQIIMKQELNYELMKAQGRA